MTLFASEGNARTFNYMVRRVPPRKPVLLLWCALLTRSPRTQPGDVGFVPASFGHYVENTGNSTLRFLEIFNTDRYQDISLQQVRPPLALSCPRTYSSIMMLTMHTCSLQWLALTPPALVQAHLQLDDETIAHLSKTKLTVVGPAASS